MDAQDAAELRMFRGDALVSRRRFEQLPKACSDRRDAVALSIALALEGAARELATPVEAADSTATEGGDSVEASARHAAVAEAEQPKPSTQAQRELFSQPSAAEEEEAAVERQDSAAEADEPAQASAPGGGLIVHLHLGAGWLVGAVPDPVWTGSLGIVLWLNPHLAFDLSAIASTLANSEFVGGRVETRLVGGELFGCTGWKIGNFAAQGCAGLIAAACAADGYDYPEEYPAATLLWMAGAARFGLRWPNEGLLSVRGSLQLHFNLVRPELNVAGSTEKLYPFWIGGAAGLDMILALE
ncbi:MAG TPA: hypothetical protein VJV78_03950 [Polyangiales bacterium]|nr:hypothetical protein [Polyangiales bacterium]